MGKIVLFSTNTQSIIICSIENSLVCIVTRIFEFLDNLRCVHNCISICNDFDIWRSCAISNRPHCWSGSPDLCCPAMNCVADAGMYRPVGDEPVASLVVDAIDIFSCNWRQLKWDEYSNWVWIVGVCVARNTIILIYLPCDDFNGDNVLDSFSMTRTLMKLFCEFIGDEDGFWRGTLPLATLNPRPWAFDWCGTVASIATSFSAATFNRPIILNCAPAFARHSDINTVNRTSLLIALMTTMTTAAANIFACARAKPHKLTKSIERDYRSKTDRDVAG